ncbi:type II toxin-antitoxin system VapC family toxin [Rhizobium sp. 18055]|uniref:type II toxin-antitoxin system VapC family toxin n=1 Tax=Rhizobium sp. 18055 TaxID=2681403 RepID=UPI001356E33E|nr:type II toxin-antitoxin system VapC family toxin [Rhizobium sp. 18055]
MKFLLDTHFLLWTAEGSRRLPKDFITLVEDDENELFFSVASIWEIAIKVRRRPNFDITSGLLRRFLLDNRFNELLVTGEHAVAVENLPTIHGDPFDRLLVAQAFTEGLVLLTVDRAIAKYGGPIRLM